jgi:uncharacterized Zn finger protein
VGQKLANARRDAIRIAKKQGREPSPVKLEGRKIATTFWGRAWCDNLEAYSDYANRLPRGATYVRNGSVVDLVIKPRCVHAIVAGSETYTVKINIAPLAKPTWKKIKADCSASIDSLLDLLAGRFNDGVMQRLTRQKDGLFPSPREIEMKCSCPDWSDCCKHLAAVMYGIGARLDQQPELLFLLRDVDHQELVTQAVAEGNLDRELAGRGERTLEGEDLGAMFGIELDTTSSAPSSRVIVPRKRKAARATAGEPVTTGEAAQPRVTSRDAAKSTGRTVAARPPRPVARKGARKRTLAKKTAARRSALK